MFVIKQRPPCDPLNIYKELGETVKCSYCGIDNSTFWRKGDHKKIVCEACWQSPKLSTIRNRLLKPKMPVRRETPHSPQSSIEEDKPIMEKKENRKYKGKFAKIKKLNKIKSRHAILKKKNPKKSPRELAFVTTSDSILHKGVYYVVGDVVSCVDVDDGRTYYACVRGFLTNEFCDKAVVVTWLIPTGDVTTTTTAGGGGGKQRFDINTYIPGPSEEDPRNLDEFTFVCHSNYEESKDNCNSFIWGRAHTFSRPTPVSTAIFGAHSSLSTHSPTPVYATTHPTTYNTTHSTTHSAMPSATTLPMKRSTTPSTDEDEGEEESGEEEEEEAGSGDESDEEESGGGGGTESIAGHDRNTGSL